MDMKRLKYILLLILTLHSGIFYGQHKTSNTIVMLGNSLTEYAGDWNKLLHTGNVLNKGVAGNTATDILNRLEPILRTRPKAIFLMVGINDICNGQTASQVFERCQNVIDRIWAESPGTKLYVQSLLPINESFGQWKTLDGKTDEVAIVNRLLRHYCEKNKISYINLFAKFNRHGTNEMRRYLTCDGLHLTSQGYKIWAFEIQKFVDSVNGNK